jgi:hypothetical protein
MGSSDAIKRRKTENPSDKRERVHQRPYIEEGQTTQWIKERGVIRGHKEKKDRQPNGQRESGLSVLLVMASDEPSLFCPLGCLFFFSLWPLMTPFSFVHWVVCPSSLYGL